MGRCPVEDQLARTVPSALELLESGRTDTDCGELTVSPDTRTRDRIDRQVSAHLHPAGRTEIGTERMRCSDPNPMLHDQGRGPSAQRTPRKPELRGQRLVTTDEAAAYA